MRRTLRSRGSSRRSSTWRSARRRRRSRVHAPPARAARHRRAPPARVGGDARTRSRPVRGRAPPRACRAHSAPARSPARRCPLPAAGRLDAQLARRRRRPGLRARLSLRGVRALHAPVADRRGARSLVQSEFGFAHLPGNASTGSSMMPQKLNPDVAELARGKAGTQIGRLTGLLAVVKGLPLAYDRDLQEDKTPLFATRRDVRRALAALGALVGGIELDAERLAAAVADPLLRATDAAEALVRDGVPVPRRTRAGRFRRPGGNVHAAREDGAARRARPGRRHRRAARRPPAARGPRARQQAAHAPRTRPDDVHDLERLRARFVLDLAEQLKAAQKNGIEHRLLPGRSLGLLFTPPVHAHARLLRSGDGAARRLGDRAQRGRAPALARRAARGHRARAVRLPRRAGRALAVAGRPGDARVARVDPGDQRADRRGASVPGTRRRAHDPRALAATCADVRVAYVGDGNNVCASLLIACSALGAEVVCATPRGYEPGPGRARRRRARSAARCR